MWTEWCSSESAFYCENQATASHLAIKDVHGGDDDLPGARLPAERLEKKISNKLEDVKKMLQSSMML